MPYIDELDYDDEIRGVVCPECGGSLVWRRGRAFCDEHRYVEPRHEKVIPEFRYGDAELAWIQENSWKLGDELDEG